MSSLVLICIYWIDTKCKIISYFQKMYTVKHNVFMDAHRVWTWRDKTHHMILLRRLNKKKAFYTFHHLLLLFPLSSFYYILDLTFMILRLCLFLLIKQLEVVFWPQGSIFISYEVLPLVTFKQLFSGSTQSARVTQICPKATKGLHR